MKKIKLFEEFMQIAEKKGDSYDYGCVMLYFNFPEMKDIHNTIDENDLYTEEGDRTYGLADEPHCTLLYGLHKEVSADQIKTVVKNYTFDDLKLQNASLFENQYDVLKFDVTYNNDGESFLHDCNKELCTLPHTTSFPDYHPHATIAYLKKGMGKKYVDQMEGLNFTVKPSHIIYSMANGDKIKIEL